MHVVILMTLSVLVQSHQSEENSGSPHQLQPCERYGDTHGSWYASGKTKEDGTNYMQDVPDKHRKAHFNNGFIGTAENFTNIWLPRGCSYHRFSAEEIYECANITRETMNVAKNTAVNHLEMIFLGDSALRGILRGIGRILAGNEVTGPNVNAICGGTVQSGRPVSAESAGTLFSLEYQNLRITFGYVKIFHDKYFQSSWHQTLSRKPYAVVVNSGAWDFDRFSRAHSHDDVSLDPRLDHCQSNESLAISSLRSNSAMNRTILEMSDDSKNLNFRLIYRNNHHNGRFGCYCADEKFEALLHGTNWEVWDNSRMSNESWVEQTWDGFHFDRTRIHSVDDHISNRQFSLGKGWEYTGQLEMQFAHSLLNALFHHTFGYNSSHH
jgi:hypothetical protein